MHKNPGIIILFLFMGLAVNSIVAQDTIRADSMVDIIATAPRERLVYVFDAMEKNLARASTGQALSSAFQALSAARNSKKILAEVLACRNIARIYDRIGNKEEALRYYDEALLAATNHRNDNFALALAEYNIGEFLSKQELLSEGLQHILNAAKTFEDQKMYSYVVLCHYEGCMINYRSRNYRQCIEEGYNVLNNHEKN